MRYAAAALWCGFWWALPALCILAGGRFYNFIGMGVTVAAGATFTAALYLTGHR